MLDTLSLFARDGIEIADVACRHRAGRGETAEHVDRHAIVLVRRGCFVLTADGIEATLDPTLAYCLSPLQEVRYDHPHDAGDDCTVVFLDAELVERLRGGERSLPPGPIPTTPELDVQHRLLLPAAGAGDRHDIVERSVLLAAAVLEQDDPGPIRSGRPASAVARRSVVDGARQLLAADPDRSLPALGRELAVSPHHLSRIFRDATGQTVSRHRVRLRVRMALERLAGGDHDLARLASELGFADQSHLTRSVRAETGTTPAALRHALASGETRQNAGCSR